MRLKRDQVISSTSGLRPLIIMNNGEPVLQEQLNADLKGLTDYVYNWAKQELKN